MVFFEISDVCNALCPWCERGSRNRKLRPPVSRAACRGEKFIPLHVFNDTIDFLLDKGLILEYMSTINLFNWGEPLLHPQFYDIVSSLKDRKLLCQISTNGSVVIEDRVSFAHVTCIWISMPGFSQKAYDRTHGFSFKKVTDNIKKSIENIKRVRHDISVIRIYAHRYKHNENEVKCAQNFAKHLGVSFQTSNAYFNCTEYAKQYIQNTLPEHILRQAQEELILSAREDFVQPETPLMSKDTCTQLNYLTLSHRGRPSTCCIVDLDSDAYELLDFKDHPNISCEELNQIRKDHPFCQECRRLGINTTIY